MLEGISASPGLAMAKALLFVDQAPAIDAAPVAPDVVAAQQDCFRSARDRTVEQLQRVRDQALTRYGEERAAIFEGHILLAEDEEFADDVLALIKDQRLPAAAAVDQVIREHAEALAGLDDAYLRARAADTLDIGRRLVMNCLGRPIPELSCLPEDVILVAADLTPSQAATLDLAHVKGVITEGGSRTAHFVILAQSRELPVIVAAAGATRQIANGQLVLLDAVRNVIRVAPTAEQIQGFVAKQAARAAETQALQALIGLPAETTDGRRVELAANIGTPDDMDAVLRYGADGVGLFRTEFLFMDAERLPDEAQQFEAYRRVVTVMGGKPVIIRTMDIGGDKDVPALGLKAETNPFLGYRAIRLYRDNEALLTTQLRAMLRASTFGTLRIMFPMVTSLEEILFLKTRLAAVQADLDSAGIPFDRTLQIGAMVETPAAALHAAALIRELDFFSIGSNDLTQYTLAVDRTNERIAGLYQPLHPAVLRLIKMTIDAAHAAGKRVGLCGEFGKDPAAALLLVGLGIDELSMHPGALLRVKRSIRGQSWSALQTLADKALSCGLISEVQALLG